MKLKIVIFSAIFAAGLISCKKEKPASKLIDPLPIKTNETVIPAYGTRDMMLLRKNLMRIVIAILNRTTLENPTYPELSGTGPFTFTVNEPRVGISINYSLQFLDVNGGTIDPIGVQSSSSSIKSMTLTGSGQSTLFPTITDSLTLTLDTTNYFPGNTVRMTGTASLSDTNYSLPFAITSPARINLEGLRDGAVSVNGTGPTTAVTMSLSITNDHSIDGTMTWEGQEAGLHISDSGAGFVITDTARIPID